MLADFPARSMARMLTRRSVLCPAIVARVVSDNVCATVAALHARTAVDSRTANIMMAFCCGLLFAADHAGPSDGSRLLL
jgi:hypothetical protein